jgi:hypothetical protein
METGLAIGLGLVVVLRAFSRSGLLGPRQDERARIGRGMGALVRFPPPSQPAMDSPGARPEYLKKSPKVPVTGAGARGYCPKSGSGSVSIKATIIGSIWN